MGEQRPKTGEIYKHFKGNMYEILTIALHTETEEDIFQMENAIKDGNIKKYFKLCRKSGKNP